MIHNTHFSQFLSPMTFSYVTGTWTMTAGVTTGTVAMHKAAAAETAVVTIPIMIPSNSVALNGCKLVSIEVEYQVNVADLTSITAALNKVTMNADTVVPTVSAVTITQAPTAANAKVTNHHRLVITITTPAWIDNDEYYLLQLTCVAPSSTTLDFQGALANFTFRA